MSQAEFFARSPAASPAPYRPGMYDDAIKAGLDALPDRFPAAASGRPPIRATRKAAHWAGSIYRAHAYLAGRTREPEHQAELDALLEQTIAAGPDFAKVRRSAEFAAVPAFAYSREAAGEIMRQAREIERESYAGRDKGKHAGALGLSALRLLEWFCFVMWPKARLGMVPSLAHVAAGARMSRATVVEAMKTLERFGFLTINRRRKRIETPLGARIVQATNAYTLGFARGLGALALAAFGKRPQATAEPSESRKSPAIRSEHFSSEAPAQIQDRKPVFPPLRL
jgi:hypothetical protein